jgi:hypothetical protein
MRGPCARCRCVHEDPYAIDTRQLLENELEQSCIVHMVLRVLLAYGVHGQANLMAIVRLGGCLDAGQQRERELWDSNDDTIHGHLCRFQFYPLYPLKTKKKFSLTIN